LLGMSFEFCLPMERKMTRFEELTKLFDPWRGLALPADGVGLQHSLATNSLISQLPRPHRKS
jgi:hypothetical protein